MPCLPSVALQRRTCRAAVCIALALTLSGLGRPAQAQSEPPERPRVAVLTLHPMGATPEQAAALTESLNEALLETGRAHLVERALVKRVLAQEEAAQSGCTTPACAAQVGHILRAQRVVAGRVEHTGTHAWRLSAILVDVQSGRTLQSGAVDEHGSFLALLTSGVLDLSRQLVPPPTPLLAKASPGPPGKGKPGPVFTKHAAWILATFAGVLGTYEFYVGYRRHVCGAGDTNTVGFTACDDARATRDKDLALLMAALTTGALIQAIRSAGSVPAATAWHGFRIEPGIVPEPGRPALALSVSRRW